MNVYPAGYSSEEEEFDDFGYEIEKPKKNHSFVPRTLTPDEKLIDAVCKNDVEMVKEALDEGADIHHKSNYSMNHSPIMTAASYGSFEAMEYLISRGANVNDDFEMFNVIMCLCNSSLQDETVLLKCLNLLLQHGADPLATDWLGATSLINAVRRSRKLLAAKLIESGCSVNKADSEGWTPLFYAVQTGSIVMTKFLIDSGGDINSINRFGSTLWEHAAPKNDEELSALVMPKELMEATQDETVDHSNLCSSQFRIMMKSAPKMNDRLFGFHDDADRFLRGIGLDKVASDMERKNIQFAELMTWNEQDWIKAGIHLSYPLKKLDLCVKKYHEKEWSKGSIPNVAHVVSKDNEVVELFDVVRFLLSCLRIAHINSTTSLYVLNNFKEPPSSEMMEELENILRVNSIVRKQIRILKSICQKLDNPTLYPPDIIVPERRLMYVDRKDLLTELFCRSIAKVVCACFVHIVLYEWKY